MQRVSFLRLNYHSDLYWLPCCQVRKSCFTNAKMSSVYWTQCCGYLQCVNRSEKLGRTALSRMWEDGITWAFVYTCMYSYIACCFCFMLSTKCNHFMTYVLSHDLCSGTKPGIMGLAATELLLIKQYHFGNNGISKAICFLISVKMRWIL